MNLRWIGIALAVIFNVQAINIITEIYSDRQLRDKLVKMGEGIVDNNSFLDPIYTSSVNVALADIDSTCNQKIRQINDDISLSTKDTLIKAMQRGCLAQRMALADSFANLRYKQAVSITDSLKIWDLPIGWKFSRGTAAGATGADGPSKFNWLWYVAGWLLSGFAISAGAPFWFSVLNKLVGIRRAGKKPDESK